MTLEPSTRLFVECTYTYLSGGRGGIRRVTRNLVNFGPSISDASVQVVPVVWGGLGFYALKPPLRERAHPLFTVVVLMRRVQSWLLGAVGALATAFRQATLIFGRVVGPQRLMRVRITVGLVLGWLRQLMGGRMGARGIDEAVYILLGVLAVPMSPIFMKRVRFRPGDIVVLVDSTWNSPRLLGSLLAAQKVHGLRLGVMLHDLFPLTIPEMCHQDSVRGFIRWFTTVAPAANFFITNSEATRHALQTYLKANPRLRPSRLHAGSFPLGADIGRPSRGSESSSEWPRIQQLSGFVLLAVGTIEPRKNYATILDAFDLISERLPVSLLIVGHEGWKSVDVITRLESHPLYGTRLIHLDDAGDGELSAAFVRANALLCASWAEGFGLPIVEGLMHGVPVIASDIEVFRELGGSSCIYFPPSDAWALSERIEDLYRRAGVETTQEGPEEPTQPRWIDWQESTRRFKHRVLELAGD